MFTIGNEELTKCPPLKDYIICPQCGQKHEIEFAKDDEGNITHLAFYKCGGKAYLAGIDGKDITGNLK